MRRATNADISSIEVEVDRPRDRARKRNDLSGGPESASVDITGSGATGTLVANNSAGAWYIEGVTISAVGASLGTVVVTIDVVDSSGTTHYGGTTEAVTGSIDLGGVPVLSGWSVNYTIEQSDSSEYTVNVLPIIREPSPDESSDDTVNKSNNVDGFEHDSLSTYYSGVLDSFSVVGDPTHRGNHALQADTGDTDRIYSVPGDGLENYPSSDDAFQCHVRSSTVDWENTHIQDVCFGADADGNAYSVRVDWYTRDNVYVVKLGNWSQQAILDRETNVEGDLSADEWVRIEVDRSAGEVGLFRPSTNARIASMAYDDDEYAGNDGIAYRNRTLASGETYYYDSVELIE